MTYEKPAGLHQTAYTNGELVLSLHRQLFLLREALLQTVAHPVFYPNLFRALRVLVIDQHRGRLGHLAAKLGVTHGVKSMLSNVPEGGTLPPREGRDDWADLRRGMTGILFINACSRWLQLRGVETPPPEPCLDTDFWVYLEEEIISNKTEFGAAISRATLIAELTNDWDVAHASKNYSTFLRSTLSLGASVPYFLEIAQEVAVEVLSFGQKVLERGREQYRDQVAAALLNSIPVPASLCGQCRLPLAAHDEFTCQRCGSKLVPPAARPSLFEELSSLFFFGGAGDVSEGTVAIYLNASILHSAPLSTIPLVSVEGKCSQMVVERTDQGVLRWEMHSSEKHQVVEWRVEQSPTEGLVMVFFRWAVESISITSETTSNELLEVDSNGMSRVVSGTQGN